MHFCGCINSFYAEDTENEHIVRSTLNSFLLFSEIMIENFGNRLAVLVPF